MSSQCLSIPTSFKTFSLLSFAAAKCNGFPGMIIDGGDSMEGVHEKPISHEEDTDIEKMW
jgi:hypothetical protein